MFGFQKKKEARKEKYIALCDKYGMQFLGKDEFGTHAYLKGFQLFRKGNGTISNLCQKKSPSLDEEINIFDYRYVIYTGKTTVSVDQTIYFVNSKHLALPEFFMQPEKIGHKIGAFLGWEDIDFEMYPQFSNTYHLTGENEEFIRHHFDDSVLKYFSTTSGWTVEAANYYLIFYSHGSLVPDNILVDFNRVANGVYDLFKS